MMTSALNLSAPANGAAPQDAVQGRGGKEKSEDFGNALSNVSQRQSKGQGDERRPEGTASASGEQDAAASSQVAQSPRISISGIATASATLRMDLTLAGSFEGQAAKTGEAQLAKSLDDGEPEARILQSKPVHSKVKTKNEDKVEDADASSPKIDSQDSKAGEAVPVTADASIAADGVNSVLSLLTGSAEAAALAHGATKAGNAQNTAVRGSSEEGKRDASAAQKQAAIGDTLPNTELDLQAEVPGTASAGGEKTFRFAGPRGSSMDMIIGTGADGKATFETGRGGTGGAEQVTVLDARRFLGFGQSQNGAALTSAISNDQDWAAAMHPSSALSNAAAQSSTGNVVNTLKIQMTPVDLGSVTATLRLVGEQLSVHLTVETRAAHSQLTSDSNGILEALRSQGFAVDQVTVTITPTSQSDNSQQSNDPGQRGATMGQQGNGGSGQGQGQQSSRSESAFMTGNEDYETAADPRTGAASGRDARTGDIYL